MSIGLFNEHYFITERAAEQLAIVERQLCAGNVLTICRTAPYSRYGIIANELDSMAVHPIVKVPAGTSRTRKFRVFRYRVLSYATLYPEDLHQIRIQASPNLQVWRVNGPPKLLRIIVRREVSRSPSCGQMRIHVLS